MRSYLEDRSQDVDNSRLHHPVAYRGDAQGSFLRAPRLGNRDTADALRLVAVLPQLFPPVPQVLERVVLKLLDRDVIDARGAPGGNNFRRGRGQVARCVDLVDEAEPDSSLDPIGVNLRFVVVVSWAHQRGRV